MKVTEFQQVTVEAFLDYIYADKKLNPAQDTYQSVFDNKRLTPDLLRMCHMYHVKTLLDKCVEHLMKNIMDTNVVDIWVVAEKIGNDGLKEMALDHIGKK